MIEIPKSLSGDRDKLYPKHGVDPTPILRRKAKRSQDYAARYGLAFNPLGEYIIATCTAKGMPALEVANTLKRGRAWIWDVINGRRRPSDETLTKIAGALDCPADTLMLLREKQWPSTVKLLDLTPIKLAPYWGLRGAVFLYARSCDNGDTFLMHRKRKLAQQMEMLGYKEWWNPWLLWFTDLTQLQRVLDSDFSDSGWIASHGLRHHTLCCVYLRKDAISVDDATGDKKCVLKRGSIWNLHGHMFASDAGRPATLIALDSLEPAKYEHNTVEMLKVDNTTPPPPVDPAIEKLVAEPLPPSQGIPIP